MGVLGDDEGYWQIDNWATRVVALTPENGEVNVDVVLALPWLEGVVAGASCYDSDTHRFFIWGIDNTGQADSWGWIAHLARWSAM